VVLTPATISEAEPGSQHDVGIAGGREDGNVGATMELAETTFAVCSSLGGLIVFMVIVTA
jgi:hypothetical protein